MKDTPALAFYFSKCGRIHIAPDRYSFFQKSTSLQKQLQEAPQVSEKKLSGLLLGTGLKCGSCVQLLVTPPQNETYYVPFAAADAEPGKPYCDHNQNKSRQSHIEYTPL